MLLICGHCARLKMGELVKIKQNRFNSNGRLDAEFGNATGRFICLECGYQMEENSACAVVFATGEEIRSKVLLAAEHYYNERESNL